jgi:hypothetical protein
MKFSTFEENVFLTQIKREEKVGRFLRAKRDISKGDVLITEMPAIIGPKYHASDEEESPHSFNCVGCFEHIKVLYHKCPACLWPACSSECAALANPELHDIECQLLRAGKGPRNKMDINSIKNYYRSDALMAIKILLLQLKNPKKYNSIMEMESNEKKRALTTNFR